MTTNTALCATAAAALLLSSPVFGAQQGMLVDSNTGAITYPLIPQHVQRRRLGLSEQMDDVSPEHEEFRRTARRKLGQGGSSAGNGDYNHGDYGLNNPFETMAGLYMGYGTHYVDLWCGTPAQRQTVIVDTGSTWTAFPCSECDDCGQTKYHIDESFEEAMSSTFNTHNCDDCSGYFSKSTCNEDTDLCDIEQYYSEGSSWEAFQASDTCYLGGMHVQALGEDHGLKDDINPGHANRLAFDTKFACQTKVTGLFKTQLADGIMGMSDNKLAFWHQAFRQNVIRSKQFSLCYTRPPHATHEGTEAGAITLGGSDKRLHDISPMVFTSLVGTSSELGDGEKSTGYYDVHVRNVFLREGAAGPFARTKKNDYQLVDLEGSAAINDDGGVIVDSGTTDTYFSKLISTKLRLNWEQLTGTKWSHEKLSLTPEQIDALPTMLIQLAGDKEFNTKVADDNAQGDFNKVSGLAGDLDLNHPWDVILAVPASNYMEHLTDGSVMNRVYDEEEDGTVLGANVMMGHDVFFDAQAMRLGFAESSCDYTGLVKDAGFPDVMSGEVAESAAEVAKDDAEGQTQENKKEKYDEENTEEEIEEDKENIDELIKEGGSVHEDFDDDTLIKTKHTLEIPLDSFFDNPAVTGMGFAIGFLAITILSYKCFCDNSRRRRKRSNRKQREIELIDDNRQRGGGYHDDFRDDGSLSDEEDDYDDNNKSLSHTL